MQNERRTNIDVDVLARSDVVRDFMRRTLDEQRDASTGLVLIVDVASAAAHAFELHYDDGETPARALLDVAAQVVALDLACTTVRR